MIHSSCCVGGKPKGKIRASLKRQASTAKDDGKRRSTKLTKTGVQIIWAPKVRLFREILNDIHSSMINDGSLSMSLSTSPFKIDGNGVNVLVLWFQDQLSRVLAKANKVAMIRSRLYDPIDNELVRRCRGSTPSGHTLMKRDLASIVSICGQRQPVLAFYTDDKIPSGTNWSGHDADQRRPAAADRRRPGAADRRRPGRCGLTMPGRVNSLSKTCPVSSP